MSFQSLIVSFDLAPSRLFHSVSP